MTRTIWPDSSAMYDGMVQQQKAKIQASREDARDLAWFWFWYTLFWVGVLLTMCLIISGLEHTGRWSMWAYFFS